MIKLPIIFSIILHKRIVRIAKNSLNKSLYMPFLSYQPTKFRKRYNTEESYHRHQRLICIVD